MIFYKYENFVTLSLQILESFVTLMEPLLDMRYYSKSKRGPYIVLFTCMLCSIAVPYIVAFI